MAIPDLSCYFSRRVSSILIEDRNRSAYNAMLSEYFSLWLKLGEIYNEQSSGSRQNTQNTIPWFLPPRTTIQACWIKGRGRFFPYIYFSARLWLRVNRYRGGREGEGGERRKEQSELKKWNKHANASHFPSLSLPAEYKCADLTMRGTGREKGMEKIWQEGGDFSFLSRSLSHF